MALGKHCLSISMLIIAVLCSFITDLFGSYELIIFHVNVTNAKTNQMWCAPLSMWFILFVLFFQKKHIKGVAFAQDC